MPAAAMRTASLSSSTLLLLLLLAAVAAPARGRALQQPIEVDVDVLVEGHSAAQHDAARYIVGAVDVEAAPEVELPGLGRVAGRVEASDQHRRPIYSYLGIPFAEPPVGDLRFVAPVPRKPWPETLDATRPGNICIQSSASAVSRARRDVIGDVLGEAVGAQSEDCLVLNVHSPKVDRAAKLPVLVFVHGGSFLTGHAGSKTPYGLLDDDVVLVSPQYRLGVLGFLNMQVDEVPGNAGLMDMVLALQWVHDNIEYFGGDPGRVTLGGHSAGAASSSLLYLSPLTKGLVHAVMPMSGSALGFWAWDRKPEVAAEVISSLACEGDSLINKDQMVQCLRTKSPEELVLAYGFYALASLHEGTLGMSGTTPSVQNAPSTKKVLPLDPLDMLTSKDLVRLPYLTSITKHEGTLPLKIAEAGFLTPNNLMGNASFVRNDLLHVLLRVIGLDDAASFAADSSALAYLDAETLGDYFAMRDGVIDMLGAFGFKSPARRIVQLNAELGQASFLLAFNYNGKLTANSPEGIYHGADQPYLFPQGFEFAGDDLSVALALRKLVANFVTHHNPTATSVTVENTPVTWQSYQRDAEHYLDLVWPPADREWSGSELTVARRENFGGGDLATSTSATSTSATTGSTKAHKDDGSAAPAPSLSLAAAVQVALALLVFRGGREL